MPKTVTAEEWRRRWTRQHDELVAARRENELLRAALDELNSDLEWMLNDAAQVGHERAKSHAIRSQMTTIRAMRARNANPASSTLNEGTPNE